MKKILYSVMALAIATMTFTACEDVPEPYPTPTVGPKAEITYEGEGTKASPYTVADAINYAKSFGQANSDKAVYIKGYITAITDEYTTNFGNATFEISDNKEGGNKFTFYRGLYLGNRKYKSGETQIKLGDEVIICGNVVNYKGNTPETVQGSAFLYSLNGYSEGGGNDTPVETKGSGTLEDPFNVGGAIAYTTALGSDVTSDKEIYIKGKIASISEEYSTNYGNATFYISDNGEEGTTFYVFRTLYLGNRKFKSGDTQIKVGDEVIVCGKVVNFRGNTPETAQNTSYLYSLNGVTEGGGTPDTPGTPSGSGTQADPYNVAKALQVCTEVGETGTANEVYAKGIVTSITEISTQFGNGTFIISDDATGGNKLTVYRANSLDNEKFKAENEIKVGDEVVIYGKLVNFRGNTPEFTQGCYIYSLNGKTEGGSGGGDTPSGEIKTVTVADFNAAAESNDVWYQLTGTVKNLKDGDQYGNFDLEDATGSVYVYGLLSEKGGQKKKFQDLVSAKGIKNGCTLTIIGNRGSYQDKIEVTNAYFVSIEGGDTPGGGGGDTPGGGGTVVTSLTNGDFETWADNLPTGWKSASTASSATLTQSTDAHGGNYSVNVNGKESSNVRLATQEITLPAGSYNFSFWVKATTADKAQVRPGYAIVVNGSINSSSGYKYGNYADISTSWTQVSHDFTLDAETTVCLVVMNPKKSDYSSGKDVLVDDATLTKK